MNDTLRETISAHLDELDPPTGNLVEVTRQGRRIRRRRTGGRALVGVGVVAAGALVASQVFAGSPVPKQHPEYPPVAAFDGQQGLRAYASPDTGARIHLGNHSYPAKSLGYLDTDAAATPEGVLFFAKDQEPRLLGTNGRIVRLGAGPSKPVAGYNPSSKADATSSLLAWTENYGAEVKVVLYDLGSHSVVATRNVPCSGKGCEDVKVDGLDAGTGFVRTSAGTFIWQHESNSWTQLGGPKLRVADVHAGTILYAGAAPTVALPGWRYVKGSVDAQLTFDGKNVLDWSNKLEPTSPGGKTITLDAGGGDLAFYTFDTDGSVLLAVENNPSDPEVPATVYDCAIPSGHCTKIGDMPTESGDPVFIGNDM